jgi:DNA-directed RNA polymerase specialized sigma24 family protein
LRYALAAIPIAPNPESQQLPDIQPKKELTPESFARFLSWLDSDRERAGEAYEQLRSSLSMYFARRRCLYADELVDETINRVIGKVDEPIENKMGYCYGVARNVYLESLRKERLHVDIDEVSVAAAAPPAAEEDFPHECLDKCLATLPPDKRKVLLGYFSEDRSEKIEMRQRISTSLRKTQTALRMQIMRMKQKLTICVKQCMNE